MGVAALVGKERHVHAVVPGCVPGLLKTSTSLPRTSVTAGEPWGGRNGPARVKSMSPYSERLRPLRPNAKMEATTGSHDEPVERPVTGGEPGVWWPGAVTDWSPEEPSEERSGLGRARPF